MRHKKIVTGSVITLVIIAAALICAGQYMIDYALTPVNRGRNLQESWEYQIQKYPYLEAWRDSLQRTGALKDTFIYADDGTKMHSYYIYAGEKTNKTAVIVHGYTDNAIRMMMIGYMYNQMGFNTLLPDLRNTGLSEGDAIQMGWLDRLDVRTWMDVANEIFGDSTQMVLHGISMGAATVMMESGDNPQPSYVRCFVEDCGYTSVWDEFKLEIKEEFGLPSFPILDIASMLCQIEYGWNFKEASPLNQVKKCKLPMFFIHGGDDTYVPTWMVYKLYEAKPQPKEMWIAPGATHAQSYYTHTKEYTERVKNFVDKYIK